MSGLVTVVVPIYNVEKYLNRCIDSIVNQTYTDLEIILVDDGSPDGCPRICDEYAEKDKRIKVIHKKNGGLGMARNTGIEQATGEFICFFDSDDYIAPDTVETCVAAAREHEADLVVFGHDELTPDEVLLKTYIPCPPKQLFCGEEITDKLLPMSLSPDLKTGEDWNLVLSAWNKLYSVAAIQKANWRFVSEREIISEDFYSLTELYGHLSRVCVLDRSFYRYTVNKSSLSRSYRSDRFDRIKSFYGSMITLSEKMGRREVLSQSIKAITFGFTVGTMKLAVASELDFKSRYRELHRIIKDDSLQKIVRTTCFVGTNWQKKILYRAIKYKLVLPCFLFVYLKNKRDT